MGKVLLGAPASATQAAAARAQWAAAAATRPQAAAARVRTSAVSMFFLHAFVFLRVRAVLGPAIARAGLGNAPAVAAQLGQLGQLSKCNSLL